MQVLLTGAAGYTGRGLGQVLRTRHVVRGMDICEATEADDAIIGDITNLDVCTKAVQGMDALVFCHMAPNPTAYLTPELAMDVNVKGTANLYHAATEAGVTRVVLVSSTGVLREEPGATAVPGEGPYNFSRSMYVLTKILQEGIARYYFEECGINTAILRPAWIVYDEDFHTKYGNQLTEYNPNLIDPRDIGKAVLAALELPNPGLDVFDIGQDDAGLDLIAARERLHWSPEYRFTGLPRATAPSV